MKEKIEMKLVRSFGLTREPCLVCGGFTEKVRIHCVGNDEAEKLRIRACENCLKAADIDNRLQQHAAWLDEKAKYLRGLVGRLETPTFVQWQAREAEDEAEFIRLNPDPEPDPSRISLPANMDDDISF